jgi:hypothetical protein
MLGLWSIGYQFGRQVLKLDAMRQAILAYPLGLTIVGVASLFFWQAGWSFSGLYWLSLIAGWFTFSFSLPGIKKIDWKFLEKRNRVWPSLLQWSPLEYLFFSLVAATLGLTILWLLTVQPVVWDALVLYDWRAARIADGWPLVRFFEEFTHHSEFYNYDFSHPFLSSIWQAFMHKSGIKTTGLIYIGLLISALAYAGIVVKNRMKGLVISLLLVATAPMLDVLTQVYSALGFVWYWVLLCFVLLDEQLSAKARRVLIFLFLITTMLNRLETPFWLVFLLWWIGYELWPVRKWPTTLWLIFMTLPVLAVFGNWTWLQREAATHNALPMAASRSSYDFSHYASLEQIVHHPQWIWQAAWLVTGLNPMFPYVILAAVMTFLSGVQTKLGKWLWCLLIAWLGMLFVAVILEISTSPELWQAKARLLSRVSLPLVAVSVAIIAQQLKKHSLRKSLRN